MGETYSRVRSVLLLYVSAPMVESMLRVACRKVGVTPQEMGPEHVEALLQEMSHGIRLFCPPERAAQMMIELAELAE